jgi:hypothetical protein
VNNPTNPAGQTTRDWFLERYRESEERVRTRWASEEFEDVLTSVGFPSPKSADITILELHATEPPL